MKRWRGLVQLLVDGLVAGSSGLERVQKETAGLPFGILEAVPVVRLPARAVRAAHDAGVSLVHAAVRAAGRTVGAGLDALLARYEEDPPGARRN